MVANQSARQQKRSRLSDAASEKPARSNEERSKRRRVSGANENQSLQTVEPTNGVKEHSNGDVQTQDGGYKEVDQTSLEELSESKLV
ncbi:unnamed protein product [Penicillium palitans]